MPSETPKQLGFHMPAEWEPHSAVWLAWPHDKITFGSLNMANNAVDNARLNKVEQKYLEIIKILHASEPVELLVLDQPMLQRTSTLLSDAGIDSSKVTLHITDYADVWLRDYGPMFITNPQTYEQAWIKWTYDAYSKKFPDLLKDNDIFLKLRPYIDKRMFEPEFVLEGGSIEINGKGVLITTEECLLNSGRNPELNKTQIEKILINNLGLSKIIWLKQGIINDHTDGHIDDVAKFTSANTIVCAYEENANDPNYKILDDCYRTLEKAVDQDGKPFNVIKLPMPHVNYNDGSQAAVSYANFYIGNKVVLAATYNDPNDAKALEIIQSCFPDRKVVPIDCSEIIYGGGAVHCMTQQQPKF